MFQSPIISVNNATVSYPGALPILRNVSVNFYKKSFYFLTGQSGAGKTTFLRMLYMGLVPTFGSVKIFNQDTSHLTRDTFYQMRQKIGVVFQDFNLIDHLTVLENVALPLKVMGVNIAKRESQALEILSWVGLEDFVNQLPNALSGGQKQRVAIARAVITKPDILLADEPTGNVDNKIGHKLMNLFYGLHQLGTCVIIATHYREFLDKFNYDEIKIDKGCAYYTDK